MRKDLLLLLAIFLLGVGITLFAYYGFYLQEYREVPVDFKVEKSVLGLVVDNDSLHLGTISPGNTGYRSMTITPSEDARLVIRLSGNASAYVSPSQNDFPVFKGRQARLNFTATVPIDLPPGRYNGTAKFYFYRR